MALRKKKREKKAIEEQAEGMAEAGDPTAEAESEPASESPLPPSATDHLEAEAGSAETEPVEVQDEFPIDAAPEQPAAEELAAAEGQVTGPAEAPASVEGAPTDPQGEPLGQEQVAEILEAAPAQESGGMGFNDPALVAPEATAHPVDEAGIPVAMDALEQPAPELSVSGEQIDAAAASNEAPQEAPLDGLPPNESSGEREPSFVVAAEATEAPAPTAEEIAKAEAELVMAAKGQDLEGGPSQFDGPHEETGALDVVENFIEPSGSAKNPPAPVDYAAVSAGIKAEGKDLAYMIVRHVKPGFARNMAMKSLKECLMWANEGLAKPGATPPPAMADEELTMVEGPRDV